MTHTTEQERAEFEAWCESEGLDHLGRGFGEKNDYAFVETRRMWASWQAARRAPVVPQEPPFWFPHLRDRADGVKGHYSIARRHPDKDHLEFVCPKGNWVGYGAKVFTLEGAQEWMKSTMLSAAPQPPDAFQTEGGLKSEIRTTSTAPVQMPEPWGHCVADRIFIGKLPAHVERAKSAEDMRHQKLYTEQQVRQLLADNGIGKDKA